MRTFQHRTLSILLTLLTLLLSLTRRQHCFLVKKNCQTLSLRSILVKQEKLDHLVCIKNHLCLISIITLCECVLYKFPISALYYGSPCDLFIQENSRHLSDIAQSRISFLRQNCLPFHQSSSWEFRQSVDSVKQDKKKAH